MILGDFDRGMIAKRFLENKLGITIGNCRVGFFHFESFEPIYDADKNEITVGSSWDGFKQPKTELSDGPKGS